MVPDVKRKLPGRGLWLTAQRSVVEQAIERQVFARGFKRAVTVPPALADATPAPDRAAARTTLTIHAAGCEGCEITAHSALTSDYEDVWESEEVEVVDGVATFRRQIDALSPEARRPVVDEVQRLDDEKKGHANGV